MIDARIFRFSGKRKSFFSRSKFHLSVMNILLMLAGGFLILFAGYYYRKTRGMDQDDTVDIGLGTHVEFWAFEFRIVIAAAIDAFVFLAGQV
jgi:hypothetical protein